MRMIFALLVGMLVFAGSFCQAHAGGGDCEHNYDERCQWYHHPRAPKPAIPDEVCIYFIQPHADNAVMELTFTDGTKRRYSPTRWMNGGHTKGRFCIGRHWLQGETTWIDICNNTTGSADYFGLDLGALAVKSTYSEDLTACLHGSRACKEMGFKSWH